MCRVLRVGRGFMMRLRELHRVFVFGTAGSRGFRVVHGSRWPAERSHTCSNFNPTFR
jgi:hypothetical protein